jgi:hypothetical protein
MRQEVLGRGKPFHWMSTQNEDELPTAKSLSSLGSRNLID